MDTRGQTGVNEQQPSHYVVEEEFTIEVPLVRPKAPFLEVLKLAGARSEVFTKKEICHYLKEYISSRKLFDLEDPRVVHCKGDLLGRVFDLESFTIEDVIKLIELHCYQVPDTCHKRKRHLVTKPFPKSISLHNEPSSVRIAVCRSLPQTVSPVITSTSTLRPPSRKSSSSSCETRKSRNQSRSIQKSQSAVEISVTSNYGNKPANQNKASSQKAESTDGEKSQEENNNNNKRKKKNSVDSSSSGSGRKRHHTEPLVEPSTSGSSSRRRGTSFSISVSDTDGDKDRFPWYFEVEMSGNHNREDGSSEVLSIQGRETASIHDSTDDLWFLEEDNYVEVDTDTEFSVEFDVESDCASVFESDISSVRSGEGGFLVVCKESDVEFFADCSDSDSNCGDKELTEADNWSCTECKLSNPPYQRYCDRCWKMRADWLPTRHASLSNDDLDLKSRSKEDTADKCEEKDEDTLKGAERISSIDSGFTSFSSPQPSSQETVVADISVLKNVSMPLATFNTVMLLNESKEDEIRYSLANFQSKALDSLSQKEVKSEKEVKEKDDSAAEKCEGQATKPQATALDDPCMICLSKPKTASLIHGSSGHQICCFTCAKRLKRTGQVCPICRRPIQKVILNHIL